VNENLVIDKLLEKIVFDKDNLSELKNALNKTKSGELSVSELGKKILELRSHILKKLIEFIPFHIKQTYTHNALTEFSENTINKSQLEHDLEEKDRFLEKIGQRINKIYEKLSNGLETS
jgi:hypothetical protein